MALDTDEQRRPKIDWVTELAWVLVGVVLSDRAKALAGRYIDKDETKMIRTLVGETAEGVAGKSTSVGLGKLREHGSSEVSVKHSRAEAAKLIFRAQAFKDAFEARQQILKNDVTAHLERMILRMKVKGTYGFYDREFRGKESLAHLQTQEVNKIVAAILNAMRLHYPMWCSEPIMNIKSWWAFIEVRLWRDFWSENSLVEHGRIISTLYGKQHVGEWVDLDEAEAYYNAVFWGVKSGAHRIEDDAWKEAKKSVTKRLVGYGLASDLGGSTVNSKVEASFVETLMRGVDIYFPANALATPRTKFTPLDVAKLLSPSSVR